MVKSLGEFNISQSSSADIHNITWSQRNPRDMDIPKKRKTRKISPTNIIYTTKIKIKQAVKIFKIKENYKSKKKNIYEKFQNASATICKIEQGFKRKGR
mgnify:FL=1|jgi:hypothetical protein|tara:strand:+ start:1184 stop:1480 length:297 start_codon:yes stop_codon:yes gene_type:complete